jgi:F0F1-type ATP synthase gamma subunit
MSDTPASLRQKIQCAGDLQSVVRTMKAVAASSIGQYAKSVSALGERVQARSSDAGMSLLRTFHLPNSVKAMTPLVRKIQIESESHRAHREYARLYVFHNRPRAGALYEPVSQKLLPLDAEWQNDLTLQRYLCSTL